MPCVQEDVLSRKNEVLKFHLRIAALFFRSYDHLDYLNYLRFIFISFHQFLLLIHFFNDSPYHRFLYVFVALH